MSVTYDSATGNTGTTTLTKAAVPGVTWNCSSISVSMAGGVSGVNAKLVIWDGAVGTGTAIFTMFLNGPGVQGTGLGSVGNTQEVPLPRSPAGIPGIQGTPGNALNIQVTGTGGNIVAINGRFGDGLPPG